MLFNKNLKQKILTLSERLSSLEQVQESLDSEMLSLSLDPQGRIFIVNTNFTQEMSYADSALIGQALTNLVPPYAQNTEHFERMKNAIQQGKHWAGAIQIRRGDQGEAWLRAILQPVRDSNGLIKNFSVYASDLTRTIEASREHENLIEALQRSTAVIEFSLDGLVLAANDRFLDSMGYRQDQIIGKHHKMFCTPEEYNSAHYHVFWEKLQRGEFIAERFKRVDSSGR